MISLIKKTLQIGIFRLAPLLLYPVHYIAPKRKTVTHSTSPTPELRGGLSVLPEAPYAKSKDFQVIYPNTTRILIEPEIIGASKRQQKVIHVIIPDQYIVTLRDAICLPRQVIIHNGKILPDSFRRGNSQYDHVHLDRAGSGQLTTRLNIEPQTIIEEPCFYFDGEHADHFGHFLLEVMSRLWPFKIIDTSSLLFIISARPSPRHMEFLAPFGIVESQLRYFRNPILCRRLIVANQGYVLESSVSDAALNVWNHIGDFYEDGSRHEKIYVSRTHWTKQRNLINEIEVESMMQDLGLEIIHPEAMALPDQVRAFRRARLVVGPSGSALYNCVYCREAGQRVILAAANFVKINDALINEVTKSSITYITGNPLDPRASGMLGDWSIDAQLVKQFVERVV